MQSLADLEKKLHRVKQRTGLDIENLMHLAETRLVQVFPVGDGVIVAGMTTEGRAHIYAAEGNINLLLEALPHLENWYAARGALRMTLTGRVGWRRKLKNYHERDGVLFKELN